MARDTSLSSNSLAPLEWLDAHINYERLGPQKVEQDFRHDPERRLRSLRRFMELMGDPQDQYPSIHITGTNGKTSTSRMITALLLASGLRTGTYTSPHLEQVNERILVNDEPIDDRELHELLTALQLLEPMLEDSPSYFEILTASAFRYFADAPVDVAVVEVGVGGTWDATNVIDASVAVVTNIGLDHTNYLGPTRRHIAEHKAGIIKPGSTAIIGERDDEFLELWSQANPSSVLFVDCDFSLSRNDVAVGGRMLDLHTPYGRYEDIFLSLHGAHQGENALLAVAAVEAFFAQALPQDVVREGLGSVLSPGRMEILARSPLCIADGAHNVEGAAALAASVSSEFGHLKNRILVVGMLQGHEPSDVLPALGAEGARMVIACTAPSPRAVSAQQILDEVRQLGVPCVAFDEVSVAVNEAMDMAGEEDLVLVTGSLYVVGAARQAMRSRESGRQKPLA